MEYQAPYGSTDPDASYVDRNSAAAVKGSAVPAAAIEDPQRELAALISYAGMTPDEDDLTQVAKAIQNGKLVYAVAAGTVNALTVTLAPAPAAYADGLFLRVVPSAGPSTDSMTINVNGLGVVQIGYLDGTLTAAGEGQIGQAMDLLYYGGRFLLLNPVYYFTRMTPKAARMTRAFTPNIALADLAVNTLTAAQTITVTGTRYLDCTSYCAFKNTGASLVNMSGKLRLLDGATIVETSDYLGCVNMNSFQTPISLRARFTGLDPTKTYTVQLLVLKETAIGPVNVMDPLIFALHE
ncbi:hypothetical protein [Rhizobium sp. BK602]|uniref:hypothetical protein n=1 Tax=Rhizobium sp. BK602 TaxID=2586986 RepID=UPI00160A1E55|nr:hypothetical protein [Rhizobium sp. BK602]MBB3608681.1 hypothetical protein [Rhizobium sp. BK602]